MGKGSQCDGRASYPLKPRVFCLLVSSMGASCSCGPLNFSVPLFLQSGVRIHSFQKMAKEPKGSLH